MKRDINKELLKWKDSATRKPLIIRGARQVGKTYSILEFGKHNYLKVHLINFEKNPAWKKIFEPDLDAIRIIEELEILLNTKIDQKADLLFFDEIQNCPKAILSLRYFFEQLPQMHVIAAGSLLEFALNTISFPVGRVQTLEMQPMSFSEFLRACGKNNIDNIITSKPKKLSQVIHQTILEDVFTYFFVGGMPEAVKHFVDTGKLSEVFDIHSDLLYTFTQDFSKYSPVINKECLNTVLMTTGKSIGNQIKYSRLADGFANPTIKKAFTALTNARLIRKVNAATPAGIPLGSASNEKKFKALFLDIGLMAHINGLSGNYVNLRHNMNALFVGELGEQFAGQEFLASGKKNLYYWSRESKSSTAEVDYLLEIEDEVVPVEIKNAPSGRLKSLHLLLERFPNINKAYVLSQAEYGRSKGEKIEFVPLYYAGQISSRRDNAGGL